MLVPHDYWIFENTEFNSAFKLTNYIYNSKKIVSTLDIYLLYYIFVSIYNIYIDIIILVY